MATSNKNLSVYDKATIPNAKDFRFGIVVSEWNPEITQNLKKGAIETLLDSASQRLAFLYTKDNTETKKVIKALRIIRKLQRRYYPNKSHSLKRFSDSIDENGNYKPHLSKQNYPKYKKMRDIKKGIQSRLT